MSSIGSLVHRTVAAIDAAARKPIVPRRETQQQRQQQQESEMQMAGPSQFLLVRLSKPAINAFFFHSSARTRVAARHSHEKLSVDKREIPSRTPSPRGCALRLKPITHRPVLRWRSRRAGVPFPRESERERERKEREREGACSFPTRFARRHSEEIGRHLGLRTAR